MRLFLFILALAVCAILPAAAEPVIVDGINGVVSTRVVTYSEVEDYSRPIGIERRLILESLICFISHLKNNERTGQLHKPKRELKRSQLILQIEAVNVVHHHDE